MATQALSQPVYVKNIYGSPNPPTIGGAEEAWCIETATQTYAVGDLVYLDSNGTVAIATRSSNRSDSPILGQAIKAGANLAAAGGTPRVQVIRPGDVYALNLFHTTAASAVGTQATVGVVYGLYYSAALRWHVDLVNTTVEDATTALARVKVVGFPAKGFDGAANAITDIYAVVHCIFLPFTIDTGGEAFERILQFWN